MDEVLFYEEKWYMFSNFSSFAVRWRDQDWMTVEHAYQASKFTDEVVRMLVASARSAHDSKKMARSHYDKIRPNWTDIKLDIMAEILRAKLEQHPFVQQKLLETGDAIIMENSPKDSFWGRGPDWNGQNHLGTLWMKLRTELRAKQPV